MGDADGRAIGLHRADGHASLVVSAAPRHQLDLDALDQLLALADELVAEPPTSLVVRGGGKAFCVGVDPTVFVAERSPFALADDDVVRSVAARFGRLLAVLAGLPCPTVAAVAGAALGGGFELALACDVRVAADTATFALPELRLGVLPGGGATQRLPRLVGSARAKDLILTGRRLSGEAAGALGLVEHVVERRQVLPRAHQVAVELAATGRWRAARVRTGSR